MKLKHLYTNLLLLSASIASLSCDGSNTIEDNKLINNLDSTAASIAVTFDNDRIDYTQIDNTTSFETPDNIIFSGETGQENKLITAPTYTYAKTGESTFDLTVENTSAELLEGALAETLGAPSPIGTRLREIILRRDAVFTAAELAEIVFILNPSGASIFIDSDDPLRILSAGRITISQLVTSNNRDLLAGTMRGNYFITVNSFQIGFRAPTASELAQFRLLTQDHKIPFITSIADSTRVDAGVWVLSLANGEGRLQ